MLAVRWLTIAALIAACAGHGGGGVGDASADRSAGDAGGAGGVPSLFPDAPAPRDKCEVAAEHGTTFCQWTGQGLDYCIPAPEGGVCEVLSGPPQWVTDLLLVCYAECVVQIRTSDRKLDGSCCYFAQGIYVGP